MGEGGAHIHKRYEATNDWFGINRGLLLLLFMVLLLCKLTSIHTLSTHDTPITFHVHYSPPALLRLPPLPPLPAALVLAPF